jgi:hypothetical protein
VELRPEQLQMVKDVLTHPTFKRTYEVCKREIEAGRLSNAEEPLPLERCVEQSIAIGHRMLAR